MIQSHHRSIRILLLSFKNMCCQSSLFLFAQKKNNFTILNNLLLIYNKDLSNKSLLVLNLSSSDTSLVYTFVTHRGHISFVNTCVRPRNIGLRRQEIFDQRKILRYLMSVSPSVCGKHDCDCDSYRPEIFHISFYYPYAGWY